MRIDQFISGEAADRLAEVFLLVGLDGAILDANPAALECYGYRLDEIRALNIRDIRALSDQAAVEPQMRQASESGAYFETEHRRSDGSTFPVEVRSAPMKSGDETALFSVIRDITDRKCAEAELRESQDQYRTITENITDVVWTLDPETLRFLYVSPSVEKLRGFTPREILAEPMDAAMTAESAQAVRGLTQDRMRDFVEGRVPADHAYTDEIEQPRKDGSAVWTEVVTRYRRNEDTGRVEVLGVTRDIGERRRTEQILGVYAELLEASPAAITVHTPEGEFIYANERTLEMHGYTREEFLALNLGQVDVPESAERIAERMNQIVTSGEASFEVSHYRKGGAPFPLAISARLAEWDGRTVILSVATDISERKRLEAAMQERLVALTQPAAVGGGVGFLDLFNIAEIQSIQDAFSSAMGVASLIVEPDGTPITRPSNFCRLCSEVIRGTEKGRANCAKSDSAIGQADSPGPVIEHCLSAGLWDAGAAITAGGEHIASWLIGQVRDETQDVESLLGYADEIGADRSEFIEALAEVPTMSSEKFALMAQALFSFANELSVVAYQNVQQARFIAEQQRGESEVRALNKDLERSAEERRVLAEKLATTVTAVIDVVGEVSEMRDPYTAGHQRRVAQIASAIAAELDMPEAEISDIRIAGLMHDVGKMSIPAEILSKPTALSAMEFELIKGHAEAGYNIIASAHMQGPIAEFVYQHHERCDGSGYPRGLTGDQLLDGSKVLMVADVAEAMMSHRPYRAALGQEAALAEIEQGAGRLYDLEVAEACLRIFREKGFAFAAA